MLLNSTTRKLQVILSEAHTTNALPVVASYFDSAATPGGGPSLSNTNGVTAVDIVAAPAASTIRQVNEITVFNADTVTHGVAVRYNDNSTLYTIIKVTLLAGETLTYSKSLGWHTLDASGNLKQSLGGQLSNNSDYTASAAWTPIDGSGADLSLTVTDAEYVRLGNLVIASFRLTYPATANGAGNTIGGLPFVAANRQARISSAIMNNAAMNMACLPNLNANSFGIYTTGGFPLLTNAALSGVTIIGSVGYLIT